MVQRNHVLGACMLAVGVGLLLAALLFSIQSEWLFLAAVESLFAGAIVIAVEPFEKTLLVGSLVLSTGCSFIVANTYNTCLGMYPMVLSPFCEYMAWGACGVSFSILGVALLVLRRLGLFRSKSLLVYVAGALLMSFGIGLGVINWFGIVRWTFISCLLMAAGGAFLALLLPVAEM